LKTTDKPPPPHHPDAQNNQAATGTRGLITNPTKKPQQQHPHPTPPSTTPGHAEQGMPSKKESKPPADTQKPHTPKKGVGPPAAHRLAHQTNSSTI
jgi:hypothetical protein